MPKKNKSNKEATVPKQINLGMAKHSWFNDLCTLEHKFGVDRGGLIHEGLDAVMPKLISSIKKKIESGEGASLDAELDIVAHKYATKRKEVNQGEK